MTSKPTFGFALEYVTDIEESKRFYVDVLGLEVERVAPVFVQFTDHFAIASDESMDGSDALELYWFVDDAEAAFKALPKGTEISLAGHAETLRQGLRRQRPGRRTSLSRRIRPQPVKQNGLVSVSLSPPASIPLPGSGSLRVR